MGIANEALSWRPLTVTYSEVKDRSVNFSEKTDESTPIRLHSKLARDMKGGRAVMT
jgi:hypothetical protein